MIHAIETFLHDLIHFSALMLETVGVLIILGTAIRTGICVIKHKGKVGIMLGKGISLALEYLLASEVLHTLIAKDTSSLLLVGMTMVLRAAMTVLIHWETSNEEKHNHEKAE